MTMLLPPMMMLMMIEKMQGLRIDHLASEKQAEEKRGVRRRRSSEEARVLRISRLPQEPSAICEQQHTHTHHALCVCVCDKQAWGGWERKADGVRGMKTDR